MTTTVIIKPIHGPHLKAEAVVENYTFSGENKETYSSTSRVVACPIGTDTILHVSDHQQVTVREVAAE